MPDTIFVQGLSLMADENAVAQFFNQAGAVKVDAHISQKGLVLEELGCPPWELEPKEGRQ